MKKLFTALLVFFCSVSLLGCQSMSNQDVGVLTGGVAGGLLGSTIGGGTGKILAVAAGTIAGAMIGGALGKNMDDTDRLKMDQALDNNAIGAPTYWKNANSGTTYEVVPTRNVHVRGHRYCREYRTSAIIGGKQQQVYGTACRRPDGSWKAVS
jgi:surface antigen